jgi:methanogenic corrinoid protein MtbC1
VTIDELRAHYLAAQLAGDRREALRLVLEEGLAGGHDVMTLQHEVVASAQHEIGRRWMRNEVTIAQEHMASAISQLALSALFEHATPAPRLGRKLVLACVEGELHDLPARMAADTLELAGFDVRYLGANVPNDSLVELVIAERPDAIGLSVTMQFNMPALRSAVARLRAAIQRPLFIGGHATTWSEDTANELSVACVGTHPREIVAAVRKLVHA